MPCWPRCAALLLALCRGTTATSILSARQPASDPAEDADEMVMKSVSGQQLSHSMRAKQQAQVAFDYEARLDQIGQYIKKEERAAAELEGRARETAALEAELRALKADNSTAPSGPANSEAACRQRVNTLKIGVNGLNNEIFNLQLKMKELGVQKNKLLSFVKQVGTELKNVQEGTELPNVTSEPESEESEEPAQPAQPAAPEAPAPAKQSTEPDAEPKGPAAAPEAPAQEAPAQPAAPEAPAKNPPHRKPAQNAPAKKPTGPDAEPKGPVQAQDALDNVELTNIVKSELAKNKKLKENKTGQPRHDPLIEKIPEQDKKLERVRQTKQKIYALNANLTKQFEELTHQLQAAQNATARRVFAQNNLQKLTNEVLELETQVQGLSSSERRGQ